MILGRRSFEVFCQTTSGTDKIDWDARVYEGYLMTVVDAPGVGDTRHNEQEGMDILQIRIKEAMLLSPEGYDVFLYVIKYGDRFRQEDVKVLESLKTIFGSDFVKKRCILILTGGDSFEKDRRDHRKTFEEWCQAEVGDFGTLLRECDNRVVLFDNMTEDESKRRDQLARLFYQIENLNERNQNERYTDNNFETAKAQRSENVDRQHKILTKLGSSVLKIPVESNPPTLVLVQIYRAMRTLPSAKFIV
ncbi:hypothetical protein RRG08_030753 [Elysia crispata]|uniref:AIG1-type G domain-containing protein n=1 Tax=Elysia crispata TaxID=231223 RepID=A0AAE1CYE4_9GAST|nr:hypothetical protein RRG08_030753 [Elysia crispata]